MGQPWPLFVHFRSFQTIFRIKTVDFSGIWTWTDGIEGEHADHLTTNTWLGFVHQIAIIPKWKRYVDVNRNRTKAIPLPRQTAQSDSQLWKCKRATAFLQLIFATLKWALLSMYSTTVMAFEKNSAEVGSLSLSLSLSLFQLFDSKYFEWNLYGLPRATLDRPDNPSNKTFTQNKSSLQKFVYDWVSISD